MVGTTCAAKMIFSGMVATTIILEDGIGTDGAVITTEADGTTMIASVGNTMIRTATEVISGDQMVEGVGAESGMAPAQVHTLNNTSEDRDGFSTLAAVRYESSDCRFFFYITFLYVFCF
jgi:hypothetical protein